MAGVADISSLMDQYGLKKETTATNNDLDKDAFLNLLTTQMKYQDPLEPQKNEDMLAQMAQFSALEQMQNINTSSMLQRAYDLVGKKVVGVAGNDADNTSEYVEGVVEAVSLVNGEAYLKVDGKDIALSKVEVVQNSGSALEQSSSMIGKSVEGVYYNESTKAYETVTGIVSSITLRDGEAYLKVGDKEITQGNVSTILNELTQNEIDISLEIQKINANLGLINEKIEKLSDNKE